MTRYTTRTSGRRLPNCLIAEVDAAMATGCRLRRNRGCRGGVLGPHQGMFDALGVRAAVALAPVDDGLGGSQLMNQGADGHRLVGSIGGQRAGPPSMSQCRASSAPRTNSLLVVLVAADRAAICPASTSDGRSLAGPVHTGGFSPRLD